MRSTTPSAIYQREYRRLQRLGRGSLSLGRSIQNAMVQVGEERPSFRRGHQDGMKHLAATGTFRAVPLEPGPYLRNSHAEREYDRGWLAAMLCHGQQAAA